jgi:hypothetical protein
MTNDEFDNGVIERVFVHVSRIFHQVEEIIDEGIFKDGYSLESAMGRMLGASTHIDQPHSISAPDRSRIATSR